MPELFDFDVTPSRLGEMYVNTIVNTAQLLLSHEYAMAAQARTAPAALLAPLPKMTRKSLLAFLDGAAQQCQHFLDSYTPDPPTAEQNAASRNSSEPTHEHATYADRIDHALDLLVDPGTRNDGYVELGRCDHGFHRLCSNPELAAHTRAELQDQQERIDAVLEQADNHGLTCFIVGHRREQAARDMTMYS